MFVPSIYNSNSLCLGKNISRTVNIVIKLISQVEYTRTWYKIVPGKASFLMPVSAFGMGAVGRLLICFLPRAQYMM